MVSDLCWHPTPSSAMGRGCRFFWESFNSKCETCSICRGRLVIFEGTSNHFSPGRHAGTQEVRVAATAVLPTIVI